MRSINARVGGVWRSRALVRDAPLVLLVAPLLTLSLTLAAGCTPDAANVHLRVVDPNRGRELVAAYGCTACHVIPGVDAAGDDGDVGPPLTGFNRRASIAGVLPNTPDQLLNWLRAPQTVKPGNAMPDLGISKADAGDIAAYLYLIH